MIWDILLGLIMVFHAMFSTTTATVLTKNSINGISFKKIYTLKGHTDIVQSMKILKSGELVSGSADTTMRIWNMDGVCVKHLNNHTTWINSVAELADGRIACGSNDGIIKLWDEKNYSCTLLSNLASEQIYGDSIVSLCTGDIAFGTWKKTIKIWDVNKDICIKSLDSASHKAWISSLIELKQTGLLATSSWDGTIKIWDISIDKSTCIKTFKGHTDCVNIVRQLDDRILVSAGDDNTVMLWDINSSENKATFQGHNDRVYALLIVDDKIVSGSRDKTVKIWDQYSKSCIMTIPCEDRVYSLAYSPQEQYLFVGLGNGNIEVFNLVLNA